MTADRFAVGYPITCCYIGSDAYGLDHPHGGMCNDRAKYEITDLAERRPELGTTYSCESHIGALLGHADGWDGRVLGWRVAPLDPIQG